MPANIGQALDDIVEEFHKDDSVDMPVPCNTYVWSTDSKGQRFIEGIPDPTISNVCKSDYNYL